MKKSPKPFVQHIIDAADTSTRLLHGFDYQRFIQDERTQLAIVKLIENIGEACKHLITDYEKTYSHIPWRAIKAMRNRLVHEYWEIDYPTVWKTATKRVPELKHLLLPILQNLEAQETKSPSNQQ